MSRAQALTRVLSGIAHTLESAERAPERVRRVLELAQQLVPYERCALMHLHPGREPELLVQPPAPPAECARLRERLAGLFHLMSEEEDVPPAEPPGAASLQAGRDHLAVPLLGLDKVVGVLYVEGTGQAEDDEQAVGALTVVASQLATYLMMLRLLEAEGHVSRELGRANAFHRLLAGVVSHDLRGPLTAVINSAGLLLRHAGDERQAATLGRIISSAQRAARISRNLLDATRTQLGQDIPIAPRPTDLVPLLEECLAEARAAHPERAFRLEPSGAGPHRADVDPDRMAQVLGNLLGNAAVHGLEGSAVTLRLHARAEGLSIEVHNLGPPIPPELLPTLFDPFKRGPGEDRTRQGLGLGLYIVRSLVAAHGGRVEVESTQDGGTTFRLLLPHSGPAPCAGTG